MATLSWNEIRHKAIQFTREWTGERREAAEKQTFWNEFFIPGYKQHRFEEQDPINIQAVEILSALHDTLEAGGIPDTISNAFWFASSSVCSPRIPAFLNAKASNSTYSTVPPPMAPTSACTFRGFSTC